MSVKFVIVEQFCHIIIHCGKKLKGHSDNKSIVLYLNNIINSCKVNYINIKFLVVKEKVDTLCYKTFFSKVL